VELLIDGAGGDRLVEVLGLAAATVAAGYRVGVRDAAGDPAPLACSIPLPRTWSACQWVLTTSGSWLVRTCTQFRGLAGVAGGAAAG
jgi:hypothetical protein